MVHLQRLWRRGGQHRQRRRATLYHTGKERDTSGLLYYGARYYDPAFARFITPDTVSDQGTYGLNRYSYALNHPLRYTVPTGHWSIASLFGHWNWPGANLVGRRMQTEAQATKDEAVYQITPPSRDSGLFEGSVPIWGDGKDSYFAFREGKVFYGMLYGLMAVEDIFDGGLSPEDVAKTGIRGGRTIAKTAFSIDEISPQNAEMVYRFLDDVFTDFQQISPRTTYKLLDIKNSGYYRESNPILLNRHRLSGEVIAEELQHALDDVQGWSFRDPDFLRALQREGFDLATEQGQDSANRWWHRRVYTRAIKNIQNGTPGFRLLQNSTDDIYARYLERAGGRLPLTEMLSTDFERLY